MICIYCHDLMHLGLASIILFFLSIDLFFDLLLFFVFMVSICLVLFLCSCLLFVGMFLASVGL